MKLDEFTSALTEALKGRGVPENIAAAQAKKLVSTLPEQSVRLIESDASDFDLAGLADELSKKLRSRTQKKPETKAPAQNASDAAGGSPGSSLDDINNALALAFGEETEETPKAPSGRTQKSPVASAGDSGAAPARAEDSAPTASERGMAAAPARTEDSAPAASKRETAAAPAQNDRTPDEDIELIFSRPRLHDEEAEESEIPFITADEAANPPYGETGSGTELPHRDAGQKERASQGGESAPLLLRDDEDEEMELAFVLPREQYGPRDDGIPARRRQGPGVVGDDQAPHQQRPAAEGDGEAPHQQRPGVVGDGEAPHRQRPPFEDDAENTRGPQRPGEAISGGTIPGDGAEAFSESEDQLTIPLHFEEDDFSEYAPGGEMLEQMGFTGDGYDPKESAEPRARKRAQRTTELPPLPEFKETEEGKRLFKTRAALLSPFIALAAALYFVLWGVLFIAQGAIIVALIGVLVALCAAGVLVAISGIIYGVVKLSTQRAEGIFEIGLGIIVIGATLLAGVLIYNLAIRFMPWVIKKTGFACRLCTRRIHIAVINYRRGFSEQ